jgi:hypothetical protein
MAGTATWASLSPTQQAAIQGLNDSVLRPQIAETFRNLSKLSNMLQGIVSSPTGATSSFVSPAPDSILGVVATLEATEVVPVANSGLAGAQDVPAAMMLAVLGNINAIVTEFYVPAQIQAAMVFAGPGNVS